ncbi:flavin reductase family protein [Streptomyces sp. NPDC057638]|uniref:flavin reductase family protein n=1 Tax=Streptomyces sp. NPDC057638 TaxID=3346190 RepID=UPI0036774258
MSELPAAQQAPVTLHGDLRSVMRNFATGVCVVSTFTDAGATRRHNAMTINSLTSVSLSPPLISVSIRRESSFADDLMESRVWAVSILDGGSEDLARVLARPSGERQEALSSLPMRSGRHTGALLLDTAAWMECRYQNHLVAGDHLLMIGEVVGAGVSDAHASSLVFLHREFLRIDQQTA